ncbi:MAG TPA: hypothetical protein VEE85_01360 [Candidatus Bathyarchaeia archaeon]|nr:hypothetical protein [Candidatus Bathyarchaeia archaeon]
MIEKEKIRSAIEHHDTATLRAMAEEAHEEKVCNFLYLLAQLVELSPATVQARTP